jgi:hypothetical protein
MNDHEHQLRHHRSISDRLLDDSDIIQDEEAQIEAVRLIQKRRKLDNLFKREYEASSIRGEQAHHSPPEPRTTNGDRVYGEDYYASDGSGQFPDWTDPPNVVKRPYDTFPPAVSPTPPPTNSGGDGDEPTPPPSTAAPTPQSSPAPTPADSDIPATPPPTPGTTPR